MDIDCPRLAGVLGKPIRHSLSPVIHNAGYVAAGLTGCIACSLAALNFAARYSPELKASLDRAEKPNVEWIDYDWRLNSKANQR